MTAPADEPAIDLHDVAKTYGRKVRALRGIDLEVLAAGAVIFQRRDF